MSTYLLDANVVIALCVAEHEHHALAAQWLPGIERFAVCPIVEGGLLRFMLRIGESAATARAVLDGVRRHPRCTFLPDSLSFTEIDLSGLRGHRQVTDAYLVGLAATHGARLATFDRGLAQWRPNHVELLAATR